MSSSTGVVGVAVAATAAVVVIAAGVVVVVVVVAVVAADGDVVVVAAAAVVVEKRLLRDNNYRRFQYHVTVTRADMKPVLASTASIMLHRIVTLLAVSYVTSHGNFAGCQLRYSSYNFAGYQLSAISYVTTHDCLLSVICCQLCDSAWLLVISYLLSVMLQHMITLLANSFLLSVMSVSYTHLTLPTMYCV